MDGIYPEQIVKYGLFVLSVFPKCISGKKEYIALFIEEYKMHIYVKCIKICVKPSLFQI